MGKNKFYILVLSFFLASFAHAIVCKDFSETGCDKEKRCCYWSSTAQKCFPKLGAPAECYKDGYLEELFTAGWSKQVSGIGYGGSQALATKAAQQNFDANAQEDDAACKQLKGKFTLSQNPARCELKPSSMWMCVVGGKSTCEF